MKITLYTTYVLLTIAALYPLSIAQAHELKSDGSISVLLHINPDDDPVAGQPSELLFLISDKNKKFKAEECDCKATVIDNNEMVFSSSLFKGKTSYRGIFAPAIPYTFPRKGMYTVKLVGKPKNTDGFQSFSLSYDIRIDKDEFSPKKPDRNNSFYHLGILATLVSMAYFVKLFFTKTN